MPPLDAGIRWGRALLGTPPDGGIQSAAREARAYLARHVYELNAALAPKLAGKLAACNFAMVDILVGGTCSLDNAAT